MCIYIYTYIDIYIYIHIYIMTLVLRTFEDLHCFPMFFGANGYLAISQRERAKERLGYWDVHGS